MRSEAAANTATWRMLARGHFQPFDPVYSMSYLTYTGAQDESKGQATCMDAWRGQDNSVLQDGETPGGIPSTTPATRREGCPTAFPPNAINWTAMPRTAHP